MNDTELDELEDLSTGLRFTADEIRDKLIELKTLRLVNVGGNVNSIRRLMTDAEPKCLDGVNNYFEALLACVPIGVQARIKCLEDELKKLRDSYTEKINEP